MSDSPPKSRATTRRGRPFERGNGGRRPGQRNKATLLIESLIDGQAEALGQTVIRLALAGDTVALKACLDRIVPPRRNRPVFVALPKVETIADTLAASAAIVAAVAAGELTPAEGEQVSKLLGAHLHALEVTDIEQRLRALEA